MKVSMEKEPPSRDRWLTYEEALCANNDETPTPVKLL